MVQVNNNEEIRFWVSVITAQAVERSMYDYWVLGPSESCVPLPDLVQGLGSPKTLNPKPLNPKTPLVQDPPQSKRAWNSRRQF